MVVRLQTTSYVIFSNLKIVLGLIGGSKTESKSLSVIWNTRNTTVTGARLVITGNTDQAVTSMIAHFNAQQIYRKDWGIVEPSGDFTERLDVMSLLQNGVNIVSVTYVKWLGGATLTVSANLEVDFQGTQPSTQPTIGGLPLSTVLMIGGGAFVALILGIVMGGRRK